MSNSYKMDQPKYGKEFRLKTSSVFFMQVMREGHSKYMGHHL